MAFWRSKTRSPPELVRALRESIGKLDAGYPGSETRRKVGHRPIDAMLKPVLRARRTWCLCEVDCRLIVCSPSLSPSVWTPARSPLDQATEDISKTLTQVKAILYGEGGALRRLIHCRSLARDDVRGVPSATVTQTHVLRPPPVVAASGHAQRPPRNPSWSHSLPKNHIRMIYSICSSLICGASNSRWAPRTAMAARLNRTTMRAG